MISGKPRLIKIKLRMVDLRERYRVPVPFISGEDGGGKTDGTSSAVNPTRRIHEPANRDFWWFSPATTIDARHGICLERESESIYFVYRLSVSHVRE